MKALRVWVFVFISTAGISFAEETSPVQDLDWMLGKWVRDTQKKTVIEEWVKIDHGIFRGVGCASSADGQLDPYESLLLCELSDEVFYLAKTRQNPYPVPFKLVKATSNSALFSNPTHDFPNRLIYTRVEEGILEVRVEDNDHEGFTIRFIKHLPGDAPPSTHNPDE